MGIFSSKMKELPGPKLKETPWAVGMRGNMSGMMNNEFGGRNAADSLAYKLGMEIANGNAFADPSTSGVYKSFRDETQRNTNKAAMALRGRQGKKGIYNSSMAYDQEANMRNDAGNQVNALLARLFETERARDNPYTRFSMAQQAAGIDRGIASGRMNIANTLLNYQPWYQPQYMSEPSTFSQIASAAGGIAGGVGGLMGGMGAMGSSKALGGIASKLLG